MQHKDYKKNNQKLKKLFKNKTVPIQYPYIKHNVKAKLCR